MAGRFEFSRNTFLTCIDSTEVVCIFLGTNDRKALQCLLKVPPNFHWRNWPEQTHQKRLWDRAILKGKEKKIQRIHLFFSLRPQRNQFACLNPSPSPWSGHLNQKVVPWGCTNWFVRGWVVPGSPALANLLSRDNSGAGGISDHTFLTVPIMNEVWRSKGQC